MIQIIEYEIAGQILTVGFKVDVFVVRSSIAYDANKTKQHLLQQAYEQVKKAIDYEKTLSEHGITSDETGAVFVPEQSKVKTIELALDKDYIQFEEGQQTGTITLIALIKDQYDEPMEVIPTYSTTIGEVQGGIIVIPKVEDYTEVNITATVGNISSTTGIDIYPYVEPAPNEVDMLKAQNMALSDRQEFLEELIAEMAMQVYD